MVTLTSSLVSSSARPLKVRMRPDLAVSQLSYQGQTAWVVKDPVGLKYFRFREEEFAILEMLDGGVSLDELKDLYEARFPPQKLTLDEIARFVGTLHQSGLVLSQVPNQGSQLKRRHDQRRRQKLMGALANILAIRFRGVDPHRFLSWLLPYTRWLFTPTALVASILLGLSAALLVTVNFDVFRARLPAFHEFFIGKWIYLGVALAVTKVLHELGHGLSCRRFGSECHEIGFMMLVLTPCMYCDVTDSWMLKSKWQRAAIGAAGMYVELIIASLATFVWWFSSPGLTNNLMLSVMFVCSVSTVVFNANPLLRYDGYYILADLLEVPNLRQKATNVVTRKLGYWCLGLEEGEDRYLPRKHQFWFALYTVAAVIYRWVVVIAIFYFLYRALEPYGLKALGQTIALAGIAGFIGQPLWALKKFFATPGRTEQIKRPRLLATLGVLVALLLGVMLIPLPHRVYCPLEIQPHGATLVYVEVPGKLKRIAVHAGQRVAAGAPLAELENLDTRLEVARLRGQCEEDRAKLLTLRRERHVQNSAGKEADQQIATVEESLRSAEGQLKQRERELARMTLHSPQAGTVMPPPLVQGDSHVEGALPGWSGTPLDHQNQEIWMSEGQPFCYIGDPEKLEAVLVVDQADVPLVREGQEVLLLMDASAAGTRRGTIAEVAQVNLQASSQRLSIKHGGQLDTRSDPKSGQERPSSTSYQARVLLDNPHGVLRLGMRGEARIHVAWETLGWRLWRYLTRTFYFKL
ncbi:MAG: biotin/lipoyl-binding protein [Planctomycetes bacterium]|nr:biotin/lipoyl-binding protein [Planctomycetota bacterium]